MSCGNPHETPCTEVLDRVYGYLDGELDESERAVLEQHLPTCEECQIWLAELREARGQVERIARRLARQIRRPDQ